MKENGSASSVGRASRHSIRSATRLLDYDWSLLLLCLNHGLIKPARKKVWGAALNGPNRMTDCRHGVPVPSPCITTTTTCIHHQRTARFHQFVEQPPASSPARSRSHTSTLPPLLLFVKTSYLEQIAFSQTIRTTQVLMSDVIISLEAFVQPARLHVTVQCVGVALPSPTNH